MMSSPSKTTSPAVGSISRVRQRTSVDLPEPESPMTTKTSPGATSKPTSRTAAVQPVLFRSSALGSFASSEPTIFSGLGPKTFQRLRTEMTGSAVDELDVCMDNPGPSVADLAVTLRSDAPAIVPIRSLILCRHRRRQPANQCVGTGAMFW